MNNFISIHVWAIGRYYIEIVITEMLYKTCNLQSVFMKKKYVINIYTFKVCYLMAEINFRYSYNNLLVSASVKSFASHSINF